MYDAANNILPSLRHFWNCETSLNRLLSVLTDIYFSEGIIENLSGIAIYGKYSISTYDLYY